jgi:very-short-patch-repair endonuclease
MRAIGIEEFIERSNIIHNNKYDYCDSIYVNNKTKVKIICDDHGEFHQIPSNHLKGSMCHKCYLDSKVILNFKERASKIHNNRYDYNFVVYINNRIPIKIICSDHGEFKQQPKHHLNGHGCSVCVGVGKLNTEKFIKRSKIKHNNRYDYSLSNYINNRTKVTILCNNHGKFEQNPDDHMSGSGCKRCSNKFGILENNWLDDNNIKQRQIRIGKYIVDGYDPITNTVYEFNGDYWHGNPNKYKVDDINKSCKKTFGELYENTIKREEFLKESGYKIVSIWESEYIDKNNRFICL